MAARKEILEVRLSKQELAIIVTLAQAEKLPTSTLVRRLMLLDAQSRGMTGTSDEEELSTQVQALGNSLGK